MKKKGKGEVDKDPGFGIELRWRGLPLGELGDAERRGLRGNNGFTFT